MNNLFQTRHRSYRAGRRGFSFLEIMLVVVIIGVLVSIIGPSMFGKTLKARIQAAKAQMKNIETALTNYDMNVGEVPSTDQGLEALAERPSDVDEQVWEKVLPQVPKDPWGEDYVYEAPGENDQPFSIYSKGPDKREGTEDDVFLYEKTE